LLYDIDIRQQYFFAVSFGNVAWPILSSISWRTSPALSKSLLDPSKIKFLVTVTNRTINLKKYSAVIDHHNSTAVPPSHAIQDRPSAVLVVSRFSYFPTGIQMADRFISTYSTFYIILRTYLFDGLKFFGRFSLFFSGGFFSIFYTDIIAYIIMKYIIIWSVIRSGSKFKIVRQAGVRHDTTTTKSLFGKAHFLIIYKIILYL